MPEWLRNLLQLFLVGFIGGLLLMGGNWFWNRVFTGIDEAKKTSPKVGPLAIVLVLIGGLALFCWLIAQAS